MVTTRWPTPKLTKIETARLLRAVHQIARRAGRDYTQPGAIAMIVTLTDLLDGVRFDLMDEHGERLREATVAETIDYVMSPNRWVTFDDVPCCMDV